MVAETDELAHLLRALGDPARLRVIELLSEAPRRAGELAHDVGAGDVRQRLANDGIAPGEVAGLGMSMPGGLTLSTGVLVMYADEESFTLMTPQGHMFVGDGYRNNRVVHFDADGRYVSSGGHLGSGPGQFSLPHAIALWVPTLGINFGVPMMDSGRAA